MSNNKKVNYKSCECCLYSRPHMNSDLLYCDFLKLLNGTRTQVIVERLFSCDTYVSFLNKGK